MSIENEQNFGKYVRKSICSVKPLKLQRFRLFMLHKLAIKNPGISYKRIPRQYQ